LKYPESMVLWLYMKLLTNDYAMCCELGATSPFGAICHVQCSKFSLYSPKSWIHKSQNFLVWLSSSNLAQDADWVWGKNGTHPSPTPTLLDWLDSLIVPGGLAINCLALLPVLSFIFMSGVGKK
jgi:hypothetical protein